MAQLLFISGQMTTNVCRTRPPHSTQPATHRTPQHNYHLVNIYKRFYEHRIHILGMARLLLLVVRSPPLRCFGARLLDGSMRQSTLFYLRNRD
jgi:hypothetical protein